MAYYINGKNLTSNDTTVDIVSQQVETQADQSNTIGSVAIDLNSIVVAVGPVPAIYLLQLEAARKLLGNLGGVTTKDIVTDPVFQDSIVKMANALACGDSIVDCPFPKDIMAIRQANSGGEYLGTPTFEVECGCPDNDQPDILPKEPIDFSKFDVEDIVRKAREDKFQEGLNPVRETINSLNDCGGSHPWDSFIDGVKKSLLEATESGMPYPFIENDIQARLTLINTIAQLQGWKNDPEWDNCVGDDLLDISDGALQAKLDTNNDCMVNNIPSADLLDLVVKTLSPKPQKKCPEGKTLNESCDCVCPSGTIPCPDGGCIKCASPEIVVYEPGLFGIGGGCECKCPPGTEKVFVGDPAAVPPGSWSPQPEAPYPDPNYACLPPCAEGLVRKPGGECACRKNTGSWLFPSFEYKQVSACEGGQEPDPKDNCECKCPAGTDTHMKSLNGPNFDSGAPYEIRCREKCPEGTYYSWDDDDCKCITVDKPMCPEGTSRNDPYDCDSCNCPNSGDVQHSHPIWGAQEVRCRPPCSGSASYDWESDSCGCELDLPPCPSGQTRSGPEEGCACSGSGISSGSYTYTDLTVSELAKIASSFGYSLDTNMDLL